MLLGDRKKCNTIMILFTLLSQEANNEVAGTLMAGTVTGSADVEHLENTALSRVVVLGGFPFPEAARGKKNGYLEVPTQHGNATLRTMPAVTV